MTNINTKSSSLSSLSSPSSSSLSSSSSSSYKVRKETNIMANNTKSAPSTPSTPSIPSIPSSIQSTTPSSIPPVLILKTIYNPRPLTDTELFELNGPHPHTLSSARHATRRKSTFSISNKRSSFLTTLGFTPTDAAPHLNRNHSIAHRPATHYQDELISSKKASRSTHKALSAYYADIAAPTKYIILNDTSNAYPGDNSLHRIMAITSFSNVRPGDIGGYIRSYSNLSQAGDCWVYDDAIVTDTATITDNATVSDSAIIAGNASISGNATISRYAEVYGNATITDNATVTEEAQVFTNALVRDNAFISGNAYIHGNAVISHNALITGNAEIARNAKILGNAKITECAAVLDNAIVGAHAIVKGNCLITDNSRIGGSVVLDGHNHTSGNCKILGHSYYTTDDETVINRINGTWWNSLERGGVDSQLGVYRKY